MLTVLRSTAPAPVSTWCKLATGRMAIKHLIDRYQPDFVMMPSYVPEGVIIPFTASKVPVIFYKLTRALTCDLADLAAKLPKNKRTIVVSVRYCGLIQPMDDMVAIVHQAGGIMLDDRAHVVPFTESEGDADVVLYSFNKFLPVADGAFMRSWRADLDVSIKVEGVLPHEAVAHYREHMACNKQLSNTKSLAEAEAFALTSKGFYESYYRHIRHDFAPRRPTEMSTRIEEQTDFNGMFISRLHNARALANQISTRFWVNNSLAQFAFPIRCHGRREAMMDALLRAGVFPSTLVDLWNHIPDETFIHERDFIHDHLLLPIHEQVTLPDLSVMAEVLSRFA